MNHLAKAEVEETPIYFNEEYAKQLEGLRDQIRKRKEEIQLWQAYAPIAKHQPSSKVELRRWPSLA